MKRRFMEVQTREEVRCMLKRSTCLGSWCVQERIQEFRRLTGFGVMNQLLNSFKRRGVVCPSVKKGISHNYSLMVLNS